MKDVVYFNDLYDLYGELLTDKQRKYFEDYYFNNLTLSEMADDFGVSRNAISKQLHIVTDKLIEYESKLKLYIKRENLNKLIKEITDIKLKEKFEELI